MITLYNLFFGIQFILKKYFFFFQSNQMKFIIIKNKSFFNFDQCRHIIHPQGMLCCPSFIDKMVHLFAQDEGIFEVLQY